MKSRPITTIDIRIGKIAIITIGFVRITFEDMAASVSCGRRELLEGYYYDDLL